jgi:hypothetical protein
MKGTINGLARIAKPRRNVFGCRPGIDGYHPLLVPMLSKPLPDFSESTAKKRQDFSEPTAKKPENPGPFAEAPCIDSGWPRLIHQNSWVGVIHTKSVTRMTLRF